MEGEDFVTSTLLPPVDSHRCGAFQGLMALALPKNCGVGVDGFAAKAELR